MLAYNVMVSVLVCTSCVVAIVCCLDSFLLLSMMSDRYLPFYFEDSLCACLVSNQTSCLCSFPSTMMRHTVLRFIFKRTTFLSNLHSPSCLLSNFDLTKADSRSSFHNRQQLARRLICIFDSDWLLNLSNLACTALVEAKLFGNCRQFSRAL